MIEKQTINSAHLFNQKVIPIAFSHCIFSEKTAIVPHPRKKKQKVINEILFLLNALNAKYIKEIHARMSTI